MRISLQRVVALAAPLGIVIPIGLLIRTLLLGRHFGSTQELLFYPGSIFLFNVSHHSSPYGLAAFALSLVVSAALYAIAAMILFVIIRGVVAAWSFCAATLKRATNQQSVHSPDE